MPSAICYPVLSTPILQPISERIKELREEIAKINETNRVYLKPKNRRIGEAEHERRIQRLQEIIEEILGLTEWKKT